MKKPKVIIFTGPSGVGKTTVEQFLFKNKALPLEFSVSMTTRFARKNEEEGVHYYFVTPKEFEQKILENKLIEYSEHFDHKYGTLWSEIDRIQSKGKNPFLEIETNGAIAIMKKIPRDERISIFLSPPTVNELVTRIRNRATESEEQIKLRLLKAKEEISHSDKFDYVVVNNSNPEQTAINIANIIMEEI